MAREMAEACGRPSIGQACGVRAASPPSLTHTDVEGLMLEVDLGDDDVDMLAS